MDPRNSIGALFQWSLFCVVAFLYIIIYIPNRNTETEQTMLSEKFKSASRNEIESDSHKDSGHNTRFTTKSPLPLFFVNSIKCKIPYVDPFSAEVMTIYKPIEYESCTNESDLVTPIFNVNLQRYVLYINEQVAAQILNSSDIEYNCYYQEVTRDALRDTYAKLSPPKYFSQNYVVPLHVRFLILACHHIANKSQLLQSDAYSLIQPLPVSPPPPLSSEPPPRKPSVIMFGIDSISRINLRRTMPKVYQFLTRSGWYELQGYNKVADNTFPNLMAILSGYTSDTAKANVCDTNAKGCLDRIPFIWKYLKNASYLTAFAEDVTNINTFNYMKPGFKEQPTDYYMRPFMRAIERNMEGFTCAQCTMRYCLGRRIVSSYIYDFGKEFAKRYVEDRPIWGLFWSNSFSHDNYALPSKMDGYILQYLEDFESDGILRESIVIFFADHGSRWGSLMYLTSAFLESRLPMMFIYLPPWFRAKYPQYAQALELNRNRLTSNYDLHNTLKHIIQLGGKPDDPPLPKANDCPKCQSLFYPVDEHRTCADAGISEHWCTCEPYKRIRTPLARHLAPLVTDRMNGYLLAKNLTNLCSNLTVRYVHDTMLKMGLNDNWNNDSVSNVAVYRTKFKVIQNNADFLATLVYNNSTDSVNLDVETISRMNSYEKDSTCIDDKIAKKYCICKSNLWTR